MSSRYHISLSVLHFLIISLFIIPYLYAQEVSDPIPDQGPDLYDLFMMDDTHETENIVSTNINQMHNFDSSGDVDWIHFTVLNATDELKITVTNIGALCDPSMTFYEKAENEDAPGHLFDILDNPRNNAGAGVGKEEVILSAQVSGLNDYYLKIENDAPYDNALFADMVYSVEIKSNLAGSVPAILFLSPDPQTVYPGSTPNEIYFTIKNIGEIKTSIDTQATLIPISPIEIIDNSSIQQFGNIEPSATANNEQPFKFIIPDSMIGEEHLIFKLIFKYKIQISYTSIGLKFGHNEVNISMPIGEAPEPSPTNTPSNTPTNTPIPTNTPSNTPTNTPIPTNTPSNTPTNTPIPTNTPSNTPTNTPIPTNTPSNTPTNTPIPTNTPSNTPTNTPIPTNTPSNTPTNTPIPTNTPSNTPTNTPIPTNTPSNTPTNTPIPTNTPSNTPTNTPIPTNTPSNTPTNTPIPTNTPSNTPTNTPTPDISFNVDIQSTAVDIALLDQPLPLSADIVNRGDSPISGNVKVFIDDFLFFQFNAFDSLAPSESLTFTTEAAYFHIPKNISVKWLCEVIDSGVTYPYERNLFFNVISLPEKKPDYIFEFRPSANPNSFTDGWVEIPGGFDNEDPGDILSEEFNANLFTDSQDNQGLKFNVENGQVSLIVDMNPVDTNGKPVLIRASIRSDGDGAQIALGSLTGDLLHHTYNGSLATIIVATSTDYQEIAKQVIMLYQPDERNLITPVFQVSSNKMEPTNVFLDRIEIYILDDQTKVTGSLFESG